MLKEREEERTKEGKNNKDKGSGETDGIIKE